MRWPALIAALFLSAAAMADVAVDDAPLEDPAAEARARAIMAGIRCLVCQNQSIEDSNADLARDLRRIVRERIAGGDGRREVEAFLVARYGDWVLLDPPFKAETLLLWLFPPLLLGGILAYAVMRVRRKAEGGTDAEPLPEAERRRAAALLEGESE